MSDKNIKIISPRWECIIKGIFLILLSVVLIINVGPIARTFAFPLIYFFGIGMYFILAFVLFLGIYRVITKTKFRFKKFYNIIALAFIFASIMFFIGYGWSQANNYDYSQGLGTYVNNLNSSLSTYYTTKVINMFEVGSPYSSGLIFMGIVGGIPNNFVSCAFGIVFLLLSLAIVVPQIVKFFKDKNRDQKELEEAYEKAEKYNNPFKEETPVVENDTSDVQFGFEPEKPSFDESDSGFNPVSMSLDDTFGSSGHMVANNNEFSKIEFNQEASVTPKNDNSYSQAPTSPSGYEEIPNEEIIDNEAPRFEDAYLDESVTQRQNVDESLVRAQPTFEEIRPINDNIYKDINQPQVSPVPEVKKKERVKWVAPSSELLSVYETAEAIEQNTKVAEERVVAINQIFTDFKIGASVISYTIGSSVTRFNIEYDASVSIKQVEKIVDDISRRLGGVSARFTPIVQGETYSGLEVPNAQITTVGFKEVFENLPDVKKHPLAVGFGKNISGDVISADFDEFPHLLVAGTTGSGKSIYIHSLIATLIMRVSPDDLKIVLVDPKKVEMTKYKDMPHLLCPIITEAEKAKVMMNKLVEEMNERYEKFADAENQSNIKQYNEWANENGKDLMPYIIVVIDEYADLVDTCKEISQPVVSIAQKARAAGIHMLISTQRPSTNVITGVIKGNLPTRVALMTSSYTDSITILGEGGSEKLLGKGDMLVQSPLISRVGLTRLQGCFIQNKEISRVVGYLKEHYETSYDEKFIDLVDHSKEVGQQMVMSGEVEKEANEAEEEKYQSIKEWVMCQEFVSMSKIQRECGVGFNRAGRFFSRLQKEGVVDIVQDGSTKGCRVLIHDKFSNYGEDVSSDELLD